MGCASNLDPRTKYWHGPLVAVWHILRKVAGHQCWKEVASIMDDPEKPQPGVVVHRLTESTLPDMRTVAGGDSRYMYCRQAENCRASAPSGVLMKRTWYGWAAEPVKVTSSFPSSMRLGEPLAPLL